MALIKCYLFILEVLDLTYNINSKDQILILVLNTPSVS